MYVRIITAQKQRRKEQRINRLKEYTNWKYRKGYFDSIKEGTQGKLLPRLYQCKVAGATV